MTIKTEDLGHAPYADASQMILNVWRPNRWANWMFEVENYELKGKSGNALNNFTFGYGGFQGARGNNKGNHIIYTKRSPKIKQHSIVFSSFFF